jgi:ankyrin repeat protein
MRTSLHVAGAAGSLPSISFLLERGANVNCLDNFGITPLFEAVKNGKNEAAQMLFAAGGTLGMKEIAPNGNAGNESSGHLETGTSSVGGVGGVGAGAVDVGAGAGPEGSYTRDAGTLMCAVAASGNSTYMERLLRYGLRAEAADYGTW